MSNGAIYRPKNLAGNILYSATLGYMQQVEFETEYFGSRRLCARIRRFSLWKYLFSFVRVWLSPHLIWKLALGHGSSIKRPSLSTTERNQACPSREGGGVNTRVLP